MSEPVLPAPRPTRLDVLLERDEVRKTYEEKRRHRPIERQKRLTIDWELHRRTRHNLAQRTIWALFDGAKWPPKRKRVRSIDRHADTPYHA